MIEFVSQYIWQYFIFMIATFFLLRFLSYKLLTTEFDILALTTLNVALSTSLLFVFYILDLVSISDLYEIGFLYLSVYFGIYLSSLIWRKKLKFYINNDQKESLIVRLYNVDTLAEKNLLILGWLLIFITMFFGIILLTQGEFSDERIVFAKSYRWLNILLTGCQTIFIPYSIGYYLVKRNKTIGIMILLNLMVSFLSGSKGFAIAYVVNFLIMSSFIDRKKSLFKKVKISYIFGLIISLISPTFLIMFWTKNSFAEATQIFLSRIYSSGDIFYYSFIVGDYRELFGNYNFFSYLLHPFTSIFGIRGYEWPIGAELFGMLNNQVEISGYGPNPHIPILSLVLLNGNLLFSVFFCFLNGVFISWSRVFSVKILQNEHINPFLRISAFSLFFMATPGIVIDLAQFEFTFISVISVVLILTCIHKIIGLSYSKYGGQSD